MKISEKIQKLMADKNATKEQVAARLKVSVKTVENWLGDKKQPQPGNISEIDTWLSEPENTLSKESFKLEDYYKIIDIQNNLLDRYKNDSDFSERMLEALHSLFAKNQVEIKNEAQFTVSALSSVEASLNVLVDLLISHIAEGDKERVEKLKKEVDDAKKKEVRSVLQKYSDLGSIDVS